MNWQQEKRYHEPCRLAKPTELDEQMINAFKCCQFCGHSSDDICEFRMWQRCDSNEIACRGDACRKIIDDDPLLFIEVPWSQGGPGRFMLICGDCPHRSEYSCKHPDLKTNGGEGLLVHFTPTPVS